MFFFFLCIDMLRIVLQLLDVVLNVYHLELHCLVPPDIKHRSSLIEFPVSFSFLPLTTSLSHWKLLIKYVQY